MVEEMQNKRKLTEVTYSPSLHCSVIIVKLHCSRHYCAGCSAQRNAFLWSKRALQEEARAESRLCNLSEHNQALPDLMKHKLFSSTVQTF